MAPIASTKARRTLFDRADTWLALTASVVLAAMMIFVFAGAILRYAFNAPIHGGNEVVELASVAVVMLGIPYCTRRDAHVRIDLLDPLLGRSGRAFGDALYRVIGIVVLGFLVRAYVARTLDALEFDDRTNMIGIPVWPFYALICAGMGLYALILLVQLIGQITDRGART
ncbi:TRAP transporter small permease [Seohaeicola saemankumensis]|nr:TRAP transporter small permease [Seohaeicola saemankumensis]MCA0871506.1 TRAP transporter small permease [Seohaeicola saemankumensis]